MKCPKCDQEIGDIPRFGGFFTEPHKCKKKKHGKSGSKTISNTKISRC